MPTGQSAHAIVDILLNLPAAHCVHAVPPCPARVFDVLPGGHTVHRAAALALYEPGWQGLHAIVDVLLYCPGVQAEQLVPPETFKESVIEPGKHLKHSPKAAAAP